MGGMALGDVADHIVCGGAAMPKSDEKKILRAIDKIAKARGYHQARGVPHDGGPDVFLGWVKVIAAGLTLEVERDWDDDSGGKLEPYWSPCWSIRLSRDVAGYEGLAEYVKDVGIEGLGLLEALERANEVACSYMAKQREFIEWERKGDTGWQRRFGDQAIVVLFEHDHIGRRYAAPDVAGWGVHLLDAKGQVRRWSAKQSPPRAGDLWLQDAFNAAEEIALRGAGRKGRPMQ